MSACRDNTPSSPVAGLVPLLAATLLLSACDGVSEPSPDAAGARPSGTVGSATAVPLPAPIARSRAIDRAALDVELVVGGEAIEVRREGDRWTASATVPPGEALLLEIDWYERLDAEGPGLPLATLREAIGPLGADTALTIDPERYETETLDQDRDGISNLVERERGTRPDDAADPGRVAPPDEPFVVSYLDVSADGSPPIDGAWEPIWLQATLGRVDRLLIGGDPANPRAQAYAWRAMHDGEFLYLIVRFEGEGGLDARTPKDDSPAFQDDDALNLFIDADHDRSEFLELVGDGGDDRYLVFPLPADAVEEPPSPLTPLDGTPDAPENLPPSLRHGVSSGRDVDVAGWEIRVSLNDLGLEVGRPFGIEIHLDQDLDEDAERDERWAWAYPSRADREAAGATGGYNFESPARFGTAVLAAPPGE